MSDPPRQVETHASPAPPKRVGLRLNAVANAVGHVSFFAAIFLATPVAIRHLGPEGWGIWQLVGALTAYAMLLNMGLGTAIHQQVAVNTASGDYEKLGRAFTNLRLYLWAVGILLVLLLAAAGRPLVTSLVEPESFEQAHGALAISVVLTAVTLTARLYPSALAGLQRLDLFGAFRIVAALVLYGSVVAGFELGMDLAGFAVVMTLGPVLAAFPSWLVVRRLLPRTCLRLQRPDLPFFLELMHYSVSTLMYTAGAIVLYQTMKFVASWRCGGVEAAGHMGIAVSLVQTLAVVFTPVLNVLLARVGQMYGERREAEVPALLAKALIATGLLLVPSVVFLVLNVEAVFAAWLGDAVEPEVIRRLASTTSFMLVGQGAYVLALPCYYTLAGIGEHRIFGIAMFVLAITNSIACWFATGVAPRIETIGLVFGVLMTVLAAAVVFPAALRRFPIPPHWLALRMLGVPGLACLPGAAAVHWRPRLGRPMLDLALDAALFGVLALPLLELARRRILGAVAGPKRPTVGTTKS